MASRILLIEPDYHAKYPPLGLMKISTFHKTCGDEVVFFKGTRAAIRDQHWDRIYVTTMFTFHWKRTIETIRFYQRGKHGCADIRVGGILATLLADDVERETGIAPHRGLWDEVDHRPPDYNLFDGIHDYYTNNASFAYTTKGCPNKCAFCAVKTLEPDYEDYVSLDGQLDTKKKDLILLDNNVLASKKLDLIVKDIIDAGFFKGSRFGRALRRVDFNQGVDARLLNEAKMELLRDLPLRPFRIAFDDVKFETIYSRAVRLSAKNGVRHLSNYILYNFHDKPEDLYYRLRVNIDLNDELGTSIFSFPMKYMPLDSKDRRHVGEHWNRRQLRGVQCILNATHGLVGPKRPFFLEAFGDSVEKFLYIIEQPEEHIFHRTLMRKFGGQVPQRQMVLPGTG
jgi:hypothetical protein